MKAKPLIHKDILIPMFIAALFLIGKIWKQCKLSSIDELLKKMWATFLYPHIYVYTQ